MYCPDCLLWLSRLGCPVLAVMFRLSYPSCPIPAVLCQLSCPSNLVHGSPDAAVLALLSCRDLSSLFCPGSPFQAVGSRLTCHVCPVSVVLSQVPYPDSPAKVVPSLLPCPICPILSVLSHLSCPPNLSYLPYPSCFALSLLSTAHLFGIPIFLRKFWISAKINFC
jgi:hypothetical protein